MSDNIIKFTSKPNISSVNKAEKLVSLSDEANKLTESTKEKGVIILTCDNEDNVSISIHNLTHDEIIMALCHAIHFEYAEHGTEYESIE